MMLNTSPEFLINLSVMPGVPVGRFFIPNSFLTNPEFIRWYNSVLIYRVKHYRSGNLVFFFAPISEYRSLAASYPHHLYSAYTQYLLDSASTFFRCLQPPRLPDDEYFH